jgi:hypothetical protein
MTNHTVAINVLKDELDEVARNIKILRAEGARMQIQGFMNPHMPNMDRFNKLRYRRMLKNLIDKGEALVAAIKVLEGDK